MMAQKVEAAAAGHGAEPRGKRTEDGQATYLIAIAEALWEEMERDERVYMLGEDIGVYGGAFKVTEGFIDRFGAERVMDTPIAEETIVGMAVGSAMEGLRPVAEFQYADFMSSGFDEITTVLARYHYRAGVPLPVVLRAPSGGGVRASSFHSINPEPWFAYAGGHQDRVPRVPQRREGPAESPPSATTTRRCSSSTNGSTAGSRSRCPTDPDFLIPGSQGGREARGHRRVASSRTAPWSTRRWRRPRPWRPKGSRPRSSTCARSIRSTRRRCCASIEKTSRALVLYESYRFLGIGAEVAAIIAERAFEHLDAPVKRLAPPNMPVPFSPTLEDAFLPQVADIEAAVDELAAWSRRLAP